jgi:hypothetical protein
MLFRQPSSNTSAVTVIPPSSPLEITNAVAVVIAAVVVALLL